MTYDLLSGLRVVEVSAFVAAPLAGLTLAQLGAEIIRIDPPGGGIDYRRWPLDDDGDSFYWRGLNRAKKSVTADLKTPDGQAVLHELLRGNGADGGILLTNLTGPDWLSFETLSAVRNDLVMVELRGHHDGQGAVDYTVNAGVGIPFATGPEGIEGPVNNMLPAWDGMAGYALATSLLAAVRKRDRSGEAQRISVALSDIAYAYVGNLGLIAEAEVSGENRPRLGNHLFGAFGHSLPTADGRYVMIVALTDRQWNSLVSCAGLAAEVSDLSERTGLNFATDEGRYTGRDALLALFSTWSSTLALGKLASKLDAARVLWGPYRTFTQMIEEDPRASIANPMFQMVDAKDGRSWRVAGSPIRPVGEEEGEFAPAPELGAHTEEFS